MGSASMLIEAAFYKLSDYFQSVESPGELYESQLSFIFAVAIFQELQARGFPHLLPYIQVNKPYPREPSYKADIYVKIPSEKLPSEILHRWANSGVCGENWIEVKFFGGAERSSTTIPETRNLGEILDDLLRLKFLIEEGGRYLLMVFNRDPRYYLPFKGRSYLEKLLTPGRDSIEIDFSREPKTVIDAISTKLRSYIAQNARMEFHIQKHTIEPLLVKGLLMISPESSLRKDFKTGLPAIEPSYFFYLIRILDLME